MALDEFQYNLFDFLELARCAVCEVKCERVILRNRRGRARDGRAVLVCA